MTRQLTADEQALWARVMATVVPLHPQKNGIASDEQAQAPESTAAAPTTTGGERRSAGPRKSPPFPLPSTHQSPAPVTYEALDGSWDRRIQGGKLVPDHIIDLHGLSLESARQLLYRRVLAAEAHGARVILVITGKGLMPGPAPADLMPGLGGSASSRRGAIRSELPRWIGEAELSGRIAAVRRAHPRHGGSGAAYLILKRRRNKA